MVFDAFDLDAAYDEIDRQYLGSLEREGPQLAAAWRTAYIWNATFNTHDWASLRVLASPGYVLHDHRAASYGVLQGEAAWAMFAAVVDVTPGLRSRFVTVEALSDCAVLVRVKIDGAEWHGTTYDNPLWIVFSVRAGTVNAMEFFAIDEGNEARARFAALDTGPESVEPNATFRAISHATNALADGSSAVFDEVFDPGVRVDDRRRGVRSETVGFDVGYSQMLRHASHYALKLLATRGEWLSLHHGAYRGERAGGFGWEFDVLVVTRLNGGLVAEVMYFDLDDADAAYSELDKSYLAELNATVPELAPAFVTISRWSGAFNSRDGSVQGDVVANDFTPQDHRAASLAAAAPRDVRSLSEAYVDVTPDNRLRIVAVHRLHPRAALARTNTDGDTTRRPGSDSPVLMVFGIDEGRVQRLELFSLEESSRALDRFDDLIT